jgi:hypothetical protein
MKKLLSGLLIIYLVASPALAQWITKPSPGVQINWAHPSARGLVSCWLMNEGAGSVVQDLVLFRNNGLLLGPNWITEGLGFDGVVDYVTLDNNTLADITTGDITIVMLINPTTLPADTKAAMLAHKRDGINAGYMLFLRNVSGQVRVQGLIEDTLGNVAQTLNTGQTISASSLVMATMIIDRENDLLKTYHNTILVESVDITTVTGSLTNPNTFTVADDVGELAFGVPYHGLIQIVLIYNRALSADEVKEVTRNPYAMFHQQQAWLYWSPALKIPSIYHHRKQMGN